MGRLLRARPKAELHRLDDDAFRDSAARHEWLCTHPLPALEAEYN